MFEMILVNSINKKSNEYKITELHIPRRKTSEKNKLTYFSSVISCNTVSVMIVILLMIQYIEASPLILSSNSKNNADNNENSNSLFKIEERPILFEKFLKDDNDLIVTSSSENLQNTNNNLDLIAAADEDSDAGYVKKILKSPSPSSSSSSSLSNNFNNNINGLKDLSPSLNQNRKYPQIRRKIKYITQDVKQQEQEEARQQAMVLSSVNHFSGKNNRKIFRLDPSMQRLEKKSWKIPLKTIVIYHEQSAQNEADALAKAFEFNTQSN
jgi:hypothetical protein